MQKSRAKHDVFDVMTYWGVQEEGGRSKRVGSSLPVNILHKQARSFHRMLDRSLDPFPEDTNPVKKLHKTQATSHAGMRKTNTTVVGILRVARVCCTNTFVTVATRCVLVHASSVAITREEAALKVKDMLKYSCTSNTGNRGWSFKLPGINANLTQYVRNNISIRIKHEIVKS